jgi:adenosylmethionine-8-amino-7-oxononanoate aminotransferase
MSDIIILGTDTDAGKTTFALLWLSLFAEKYAYWKPVETGPSDSETIERLVPGARVHPPYQRFTEPVAPPLAARREGKSVAPPEIIRAARPAGDLLIETFGGPFSPLTEDATQLALLRMLRGAGILVVSSALGAIGRTLQALAALAAEGVRPTEVVLLGPHDPYAIDVVCQHRRGVSVTGLAPPAEWTVEGIRTAALKQSDVLVNLQAMLSVCSPILGQTAWARVSPEALVERDRRRLWHPYTSLLDPDPPLACVGAQDEFLHLMDGRQVIDAISSWWTILHGHRYPPLMTALREASEQIDHVLFAGMTHPWAIELAQKLLLTLPWSGGRVFYSDNGSTAVEVALKMAYQYWCHQGESQRTRFIGFEHGYHGDTFGAMAVSRDPVFFGRFEPLLLQADILPLDPQRLDEHLQKWRDQTAAMILEPLVQGAGGMRMHSEQVLRELVAVARRHGVLFIVDEVMTGSRTGHLWAHEVAEVIPDLVCIAKTLAGGILPLAATLVAPHIVAAWETADRTRTFFHGHSFTAHPLACAVAVHNFLLAPERLQLGFAMEEFWKQALTPLRDQPRVKDVRIRGCIAAIELDVPGGYLADVGRQLRRHCLERGVFLRPLGNVLYAMPPLCTSRTSLEQIAEAMTSAVSVIGADLYDGSK